jgi:hypothetical protein
MFIERALMVFLITFLMIYSFIQQFVNGRVFIPLHKILSNWIFLP